jgi:hypothetical protein
MLKIFIVLDQLLLILKITFFNYVNLLTKDVYNLINYRKVCFICYSYKLNYKLVLILLSNLNLKLVLQSEIKNNLY